MISCNSIHKALYLTSTDLRHCCKKFFFKGKLKGDAKLFKVTKKNISFEDVLIAKKNLLEKINNNIENICTGCPWLDDGFDNIEKNFQLELISIENHSLCNLKCIYCNANYYGGKEGNYDILSLLNDLKKNNAISPNLTIAWGGGEPLIKRDFYNTFTKINKLLTPKRNNIFTNATIFNEKICENINNYNIHLITSIDAGTKETYLKIRKKDFFNEVFINLQKYAQNNSSFIHIKYILLDENISEKEINGFINKTIKHNLQNCNFMISVDVRAKNLSNKHIYAALNLFNKLKSIGAESINFDDILSPKIAKEVNELKNIEKIVMWGAGEYAKRLLDTMPNLKEKVEFLVDSNIQGELYNIPIKKPNKELLQNKKIIICSTLHYREILEEILRIGVPKNNIIKLLF